MKQGYKFSWTEMRILEQNWEKFSEDNGGKASSKNIRSFGNFDDPLLRKFELKIPFNEGDIVFKTDEFRPLKIYFNLKKPTKNEFLIYPEDFTDKIGKLFGLKEIEIEDEHFDPKFIIQGNNKDLIKEVLSNRLKMYLLNNHVANFKLFTEKNQSQIELNIVINELDYKEMDEALVLFKEVVTTVAKNSLA